MSFITVATSLLVWSMGRSVTVATTSPAYVWETRNVTWTVKGRKAPPVEVLGACQYSRWRICFQARGDVSMRDLVQSWELGNSRRLGEVDIASHSLETCSCANYISCVCRQERALPRLLQGAWEQLLYISGPCGPAQPHLPVLHRGLHEQGWTPRVPLSGRYSITMLINQLFQHLWRAYEDFLNVL
jgi:hypothetical protein